LPIGCNHCPLYRELFEVLSELLNVIYDPLSHPKDCLGWRFPVSFTLGYPSLQRFKLIDAGLGCGFVCALHTADGYTFTL
jgi:hypothetical protein